MVVSDKVGRAGIAHFARNRLTGVCLLDCELQQLSPGLLHGLVARLLDLSTVCSARHDPVVFTTTELVQTLERLGYRGEIVDGVIGDKMLGVSAAAHVAAGRVRVCESVCNKNVPLSFLTAAVQDNEPLTLAFCAGIAISEDMNRAAA
jgi:hypothetical protein